jgi:WD40 repeat protein
MNFGDLLSFAVGLASLCSFGIGLYQLKRPQPHPRSASAVFFLFGSCLAGYLVWQHWFHDNAEQRATRNIKATPNTIGADKREPPSEIYHFNKTLKLTGSAKVSTLTFTQAGRILVSGDTEGVLTFWSVNTGEREFSIKAHKRPIHSVAFSRDGRLMASGAADGRIRIWDAESGVPFSVLFASNETENPADFALDGEVIAFGDSKSEIKIRSITGLVMGTLRDKGAKGVGEIDTVRLNPNGDLLAGAGSTNWIHVWETKTWALWRTLKEFSGYSVNDIAFSKDGRLLASAGNDRTVKLWDLDAGALKHTLTGHKERVTQVAFGSDPLLGSASGDGTVRIWDTSTGALLTTLQADSIDVMAIAFSDDGRLLASGGYKEGITLWEHR